MALIDLKAYVRSAFQTYLSIIKSNTESSLGNPDTDGKVLSSTVAGVRSWVTALTSPATPVDNVIPRYDGTNGQLQNSSYKIDDNGDMTLDIDISMELSTNPFVDFSLKYKYPFNNSLASICDLQNDAVATGTVTYDTGKLNQGVKFDGSSYLTINEITNVEIKAISLWINRNIDTSSSPRHYYIGGRTSVDNSKEFIISTGEFTAAYSNETIQLYFNSGGTANAIYSTDVVNTVNGWVHFVIQWNGSSYEMYANGTQLSTSIYNSPNDHNRLRYIKYIGAGFYNDSVNTDSDNGKIIDQVEFYNRALTSSEITAIYNQTSINKIATTLLSDGSIKMDSGYSPIIDESVATKAYVDTTDSVIHPDISATMNKPIRTSITTSVTNNAIDFTLQNNFSFTATADNLTVSSITGCTGQSGIMTIDTAENITGYSSEYKWKSVPTDLSGTERLAYFIESETSIAIGRVT